MKLPRPGIRLPYQLESSKAYLSLTGKAPHVLLLFLRKRKMSQVSRGEWIITNNGEIEFTYLEAKRYGINKGQFTRAIDQLIDRGFLSVEETGGAYRRHKSLYRLIDNWKWYGTKDFKPGEARRPDPVKRGYRKPKRLMAAA